MDFDEGKERPLAQWWELAIPVVGTLGGVSLTVWVQSLTSRRQRNHELQMRVFEDKKEAYLLYPELLFQVRLALRGFAGITAKSYRIHTIGPVLEELIECSQQSARLAQAAHLDGDYGKVNRCLARERELAQIVGDAARHDAEVMDRYTKAVNEGNAILNKISHDMSRCLSVLKVWATHDVLTAAEQLRRSVGSHLGIEDFVAAREIYLSAVRREMLV